MKRPVRTIHVMLTAVVVLVLAAAAVAQDTVDISGAWEITLELPYDHTAVHTAVFTQKGDSLYGTYHGAAKDGTLQGVMEGDTFDFTATIRNEAQRVRYHYTGTVSGDTMTGPAEEPDIPITIDRTDIWEGAFAGRKIR